MAEQSIHPDTVVSSVHLNVSDLGRSTAFYQNALGFKLHRRADGTVYLGAGGEDILILTEIPDARPAPRATGLYHFAILVPSRLELARALRRLSEAEAPVAGFADHTVSEAIYLSDPDEIGIEIYRDRPRSDWYDAQGNFLMGTDPLDLKGVVSELNEHPEPAGEFDRATRLGHVHLKVASIPPASEFYTGVLGFDQTASWGSAGFVSAGGYHHHIAFNIWESRGAPPLPPDAVGLRRFTVQLPDASELGKVIDRVRGAGLPIEETNEGVLIRDPSQNAVVLTAK